MSTETYDAVYAVPMECESCVDTVSRALASVRGVSKYDIDLKTQLVSVTSSSAVAPLSVVGAIQTVGKDAIIRGTGQPDSAAVAILESFDQKDIRAPVKGLARMVALNGGKRVLVDLTLSGLAKGVYYPTIRSSGNISEGALSTGKAIRKLAPIEVATEGSGKSSGSLYFGQSFSKVDISIGELIGRSVAVSRAEDGVTEDSLVGVIARSAGVWQNDKQVCSCTGKTIWQERNDAFSHGIKV